MFFRDNKTSEKAWNSFEDKQIPKKRKPRGKNNSVSDSARKFGEIET